MHRTSRSYSFLIGVSLQLWIGYMPSRAAEVASVRQLEQAVFHRVSGSAGKGACLGTGKAGSWNDRYIGSPTVVYDGTTYWMWFTGGQLTTDAPVSYTHLTLPTILLV